MRNPISGFDNSFGAGARDCGRPTPDVLPGAITSTTPDTAKAELQNSGPDPACCDFSKRRKLLGAPFSEPALPLGVGASLFSQRLGGTARSQDDRQLNIRSVKIAPLEWERRVSERKNPRCRASRFVGKPRFSRHQCGSESPFRGLCAGSLGEEFGVGSEPGICNAAVCKAAPQPSRLFRDGRPRLGTRGDSAQLMHPVPEQTAKVFDGFRTLGDLRQCLRPRCHGLVSPSISCPTTSFCASESPSCGKNRSKTASTSEMERSPILRRRKRMSP